MRPFFQKTFSTFFNSRRVAGNFAQELAGIFMGLAFLRKHYAQHRAIKLENVFIHEGKAVLVDQAVPLLFEKYFSDEFDPDEEEADPRFDVKNFPPEFFNDPDAYFFPAEVWSAGCILFELANQTHPFAAEADSTKDLVKCIKKGLHQKPNRDK